MPPRRVLLDECIDRRFRSHIKEHDVKTVPEMEWAGTRNGDLLKMAAEEFDVFVTVDQNLYFQQNPRDLPIAVIVLRAASNRLPDLLPHVPTLQATSWVQLPSATVKGVFVEKNTSYGVRKPSVFLGR